ncbi:MAG TPA: PQQ-dependent sugar dehydrogenase [Kofleriaceae bacterium]|nr:PQQ-dependent sugar dehydrogenase [Kofleriaceae bacterium]
MLGVFLIACGGDDDGGGGGGDGGGGDDGGLPDLPDADPSCAGAPAPTRVPVVTLDGAEPRPIFLTAPAGDDRLFIIEQELARIRIVDAAGELLPTPFLDLSDTVGNNGSYTGLLGLAFHPDYAANGRFFVTYTDSLGGSGAMDLALAEYGVSGDPDVAEPDPVGEPILFAVSTANGHYGGQLAFGPDQMLYAAFGDLDGEGGNPSGSAQDLGNLAGKILRIDVGDQPGDRAVPDDNPFVDQGGARGEVFAYGLRVPWRFAFDSMTGDFFVADVGQNRVEEVNVVPAGELGGANFGWAIVEGSLCVDEPCEAEGVTPAYAYEHGGGPAAIIGGVVYRGSAMPCLAGRYFFADHETGRVRSFALNASGEAAGLEEHPALDSSLITSFGVDGNGEMYILELGGDVYRIAPE